MTMEMSQAMKDFLMPPKLIEKFVPRAIKNRVDSSLADVNEPRLRIDQIRPVRNDSQLVRELRETVKSLQHKLRQRDRQISELTGALEKAMHRLKLKSCEVDKIAAEM